jgi:hypothetical protein
MIAANTVELKYYAENYEKITDSTARLMVKLSENGLKYDITGTGVFGEKLEELINNKFEEMMKKL